MRIIVMVLGLLVSTATFGDRTARMGEADRCVSWVGNAMYGATQSMRGAAREVEFISRTSIVELLAHSRAVGGNKLYILTDRGDTENERGLIEQPVLFGYDAMSTWKSRNAGLAPDREEWQRHFMAICLEDAGIRTSSALMSGELAGLKTKQRAPRLQYR
jgi:hypothetical protein